MNSSRKLPWLSGLIVATVGAFWLLVRVAFGLLDYLGTWLTNPPV